MLLRYYPFTRHYDHADQHEHQPPRRPNTMQSSSLLVVATFVITTLLQLIAQAQAYIVVIDAGIENECFHERVPVGTKLGFSYEVIEGGFYDIDFAIKDPANVMLHQDERSSSGKFTIEANMDGPYQICFSNKKSSLAPKTVIFEVDKAEPTTKSTAVPGSPPVGDDNKTTDDASETDKLARMVDQLMHSTISARHDVRYLTARDRVHRRINEKTNRTIVWWSGIEFILLLAVSLGQVFYLKRFFEIRRKA